MNKNVTERAKAQRERILYAAEQCFIEHGFQAAGMALISKTAGMSAGLIYRYYNSKRAISMGIIQRQLEGARATIRALHDAPNFATAAIDAVAKWRTADPKIMNAALFLEMSAGATRDPEIAAALKASDIELRNELSNWLANSIDKGGKGLPPKIAEVRAITLQCFMEGLAIRALREPDLNETALKAAIHEFVDVLVKDHKAISIN